MPRESTAFLWAAEALERATRLSSMEARGTIRLALKKGGLDAATVTGDEIRLVFEKIMPSMLAVRAYDDAESICRAIVEASRNADLSSSSESKTSAATILKRLLGD